MTTVSEGYNIWTVERKPVSVHLRESVAAQIRAVASAPQASRAGLERGGILWGRVRDTGESYYLISIEYAEHLACDHTHGEGWVPSEKERRHLRKRLKQGYGDLQCVGYWRTHERPGLYLDTRDLDLMAKMFSQPWCVALCVRPPATAGFFLWENGDIHRTSSYREFELPESDEPVVVPKSPAHPRDWRRWAAAGVVAAGLAVTPFLLNSRSASSSFNMLSMKAETSPGVVRLQWNPRSKVLENAPNAIVWIADGTEESKLELTKAQLRTGTLEYKPSGRDLNFRMEIGPFTESLHVANVTPGGTEGWNPSVERTSIATLPNEAAGLEGRRMRQAESTPVRVAETPPTSASVEKPKDIEVQPPPQTPALSAAKVERAPAPVRAREVPKQDVPKVVATAEQPGKSTFKKAFGWLPGVDSGKKKGYVPPKVVRQVQPQALTERDISVIVRVAIDPKGKVRNAALLTKGIDNQIGRSAVEAAKGWRFEPARADSRPVASNMDLRFRFEGTRN